MRLNKNIKIFLNYFLGPALFLWLSYSIYNQVKHQPDLKTSWIKIKQSLQSTEIWDLAIVIFLMIINWSIEALKWKISIQKVQPVSFSRSFSAILSGVSFSVSTPNRIGEYLGRILYIEEGNRLRVISLTIVSSISQLIITLFAGSVGLFFIRKNIETGNTMQGLDSFWLQVLQYGVIIVLLILTGIYFRLSLLINLVDKLRNNNRYSWLVSSLKDIDATLLLKLLSLSAIRYVVFVVQYFLLFRLFEVNAGWWECFWAVSVIFLVLAIIPTFAIAELGLRGNVSLKLIGLFSTNSLGISLTT
ncbi:MAG TPA: lysylphosphatidylglycerol synthase domain-containing protein, partial [Chitinophagaceae bacterium]|nr:lysylphosphatidylglycerol synthase domain-containing protein [Chitinophagaceae bacterium]